LHLLSVIDPTVVRILRLTRFTRYARILRTAHLLDVLRLILKATGGSMSTVLWSLVLISCIQCVAGMIVWQLVISYILDTSQPVQIRQEVTKYWGTFSRVMITMFEVSFNNPEKFTRILTENVSELYGWFFVIYRLTVNFVLLSVIRAVFIKQTFRVAESDPELTLIDQMRQQQFQLNTLKEIFSEFDQSGDGFVDQQEFLSLLSHSWVRQWLQTMGVRVTSDEDSAVIWETLDVDSTGRVGPSHFLQGLTTVSGMAKRLEQIRMSKQLHSVHRLCNCMDERLVATIDKQLNFLSCWSLQLDRMGSMCSYESSFTI